MSMLFSPLKMGGIELPNRVTVSPMCQYSARDGVSNDWHLQHLMSLALSAAGLLTFEATHVTAAGRITLGCAGLWSEESEAALHRIVVGCRSVAPIKLGIQLAHAGRKASAQRPGKVGRRSRLPRAPGRRRHPPPSRSGRVGPCRARSKRPAWQEFGKRSSRPRAVRCVLGSTWSRCIRRMVIC